ncbi:MAG TPA: acyl-CoA dehydrogenase family protein [Pseudonocardia sp.]|jgi:alkylation response protein AidB-like acyl-CoA dehydrogenase|nr:acyl-CoA dehydrogenase family protein [Pseudonocardia sp.]
MTSVIDKVTFPDLIPDEQDPRLRELRERAAAVCARFDEATVTSWEEERRFPEEAYAALRESGLFSLTAPKEHGGMGYGVRESCVVLEELAHGIGVGAAILQMFVNGPPRAIRELAPVATKARYLPGVAAGTRYFAIAMSEPHAGSAVTELRSYLVPEGDGYRLHGDKCYITGGMRADSFLVFCRAQGTAGSKGIGAVIIDRDQEGFTRKQMPPKMGGNAISESYLYFDGIRIDRDQVVIDPDPQTSRAAFAMLRQFNPERCGNAAMALGIARAAFERAITYARTREQFGRPICEFQGIQWKFADMAMRFDAARLLLIKAAESDDCGFPVTRYVMNAKIASNEAAEFITREAMQIHGHHGYCRDIPMERYYRDARGTSIGGGTLETNRNVLAAEVLGRRFDQRRAKVEPDGSPVNGSGTGQAGARPAGSTEIKVPPLVPPLTGDLSVLRDRAAALAADLAPDAKRWDEEEIFPEASLEKIRAAGICGLTLPKAYGGEGRGVLEACIVAEEIAAVCMNSAMLVQMFLNGPPRAIAELGTDQQRAKYLPGCASGERLFSIAISEPQAGSSATELASYLKPDGDGYRLYGEKCYITAGMRSDSFLVFCRLAGTEGAKGLGAVILQRGQVGFESPRSQPKMGGRGIGEAVLTFDGVRVERDAVVVTPEAGSSKGAAIMLKQFNPERCGNAAMGIGLARAALHDSIVHLRTRRQFGRELAEFQGLQWKVADMALRLESARELLWRAARSDDGGFPNTRWTVTAKIFANEAAKYICDEALQLHGHWGYTRDPPLERYYRDARGLSVGGGTTEVMRNVLAGEVLGRRFSQKG